ncbi:hypothetical protein BJX99DRAFT_223025, partial [Aspergillus californicus]
MRAVTLEGPSVLFTKHWTSVAGSISGFSWVFTLSSVLGMDDAWLFPFSSFLEFAFFTFFTFFWGLVAGMVELCLPVPKPRADPEHAT